jgi:CxxC motif-containing protein (DUF1111 family)
VNPDGSVQENKLPKHISARKTPPLFGLGLLEAVPTHVLLEYADPNDANGDGVSGRLVKVGKGFGRFGWKGNVGNIQDFVEGAFAVEIGLLSKTLALRVAQKKHLPKASDSAEVNSDQVQIVSQFIRFLGAPRLTGETGLSRGKELFESTGCAKCHRPSLTTGPGTAPFGNQKIFPYTDLLVHAMGPQLGDGIAANGISGQEFRTPPLWGIASTGPPYLHDGRANSVYEAVLAHGGEARNSARRYRRLTEADLAALLRFVNSL